MSVKLLTEHHLEFLSLKGGCTGSTESTHVKMPQSWKSHVAAHKVLTALPLTLGRIFYIIKILSCTPQNYGILFYVTSIFHTKKIQAQKKMPQPCQALLNEPQHEISNNLTF